MNRTHNEFGQALAPWAVRREVANMVFTMRLRIADSQAKNASHRLASACAGAEIVALDVVTVSDLDVVILPGTREEQTDGEEKTRGKKGPLAAVETADVEKLEGNFLAYHDDEHRCVDARDPPRKPTTTRLASSRSKEPIACWL